jgi:hypothetical protein
MADVTNISSARSHIALSSWDSRGPARVLLFVRCMDSTNAQHGPQRDPDEWKTGDEPMTPAQRSYLETLCRDLDQTFDEKLTKAEASKLIDRLRERSPRITGE